MGLGELFSGRIAETALLLTVALMEQKHTKEDFCKSFLRHDCLFRRFSCVKGWIMEASLCSVMNQKKKDLLFWTVGSHTVQY